MDEHAGRTPVTPSSAFALPEATGGLRSRWARRRAEKALAIDMHTAARKNRAQQTAAERASGKNVDPMSWPLRILAAFVAMVVLAVAAVIAAVVVAAQVGFYEHNLIVQDIDLSKLGIDWELNLPTFTPIATEGLVWASTLMAVVMVLLNKTSALWTRAMWFFAGIAAFVNTWHMVSEQGDLFGGVLRGGLSVAGPFLVHLFILWCRHLRTGRTLTQARIDTEIKWRKVGQCMAAILILILRHVRHPLIAVRAFGYWTGVDHWGYRTAWRAASIDYRRDIQDALDRSARPPAAVPLAADTSAAEPPASAPAGTDTETRAGGGVLTAERPAFDPAEIDRFVAQLNTPPAAWDIWADQQEQAAEEGGRDAAGRPGSKRPNDEEKAAGSRAGGGRRTAGRNLRSRLGRRPKQRVAGSPAAADVDINDLLPAAREVAAELGGRLTRDALIDGLRARQLSVGGRRKRAIYDAVKAEYEQRRGQQ